jgi:hydrogenase expression/formation protein HypC
LTSFCTPKFRPTTVAFRSDRLRWRTNTYAKENDMCLAIPGKVVETFDQRGMRMAKVQFGGIVREACLEYVPETQVGEYVLVHVGFAISRIDEAEAERTYQALRDLDQLTELESPVVEEMEPGGYRQ